MPRRFEVSVDWNRRPDFPLNSSIRGGCCRCCNAPVLDSSATEPIEDPVIFSGNVVIGEDNESYWLPRRGGRVITVIGASALSKA